MIHMYAWRDYDHNKLFKFDEALKQLTAEQHAFQNVSHVKGLINNKIVKGN